MRQSRSALVRRLFSILFVVIGTTTSLAVALGGPQDGSLPDGPVPPVLQTFTIDDGAASTASRTVTLNYTSTGGQATEYIASEASDFQL
jgi:hypothetical protein